MTRKKTASQDDDLQTIIANPAAKAERAWTAAIFVCVSVVAAVFAAWFWSVVARGLEGNSIVPLILTVGLFAGSAGGIISAILLLIRHSATNRILEISAQIAALCGIGALINTAVYAFQNHSNGLQGIFESFVTFNTINVGSYGASVTGILTVIAIVVGIVASTRK